MADPGGSATINGILFQILGTLGAAADLILCAEIQNNDILAALLIIEPAGGGGDLQVTTHTEFVAEQWKFRASGGTWSLKQVIEEVLPDLYLAVKEEHIGRPSRYRFRTNGRIGRWSLAQSFFQQLADVPPTDVLASLDDNGLQRFLPGQALTEKTLFLQIVQAVRQRKATAAEPLGLTYRKVWHLLSRFEMPPPIKAAGLRTQVNKLLRAHVDYVEDVDAKRRELCGRTLELAGKGEVRIRPSELLKEVRLSPYSFVQWPDVRRRLQTQLRTRLEREKYVPEQDVRPAPVVPKDMPIVVLSSESGQGKTWQMARLAKDLAQTDRLVTWVPRYRQSQRADEYAADEIWQRGLGHDRHLALDRVAERWASTGPDMSGPWATVCVDSVLNLEEAQHLVGLAWEQWQVQLVMTTSPAIAESLAKDLRPIQWIPVPDFSIPQLRDYLQRRSRSWAATPVDIRELIRRPVLARIYADLADSPDWSPEYEYDLMERYWDRVKQTGNRRDLAQLLSLVDSLLEPNAIYPWPAEVLNEQDIDEDALRRLEDAGWLRPSQDGGIEIWHDRLLGWAVAQALVSRLARNRMSIEQLADRLKSLTTPALSPVEQHFSYVMMDTLWLLCEPQRVTTVQPKASSLLVALEPYGGLDAESNYRDLLSTLGPRVIPLLIERVKQAGDPDPNPWPRLAARAMVQIGSKAAETIRQRAIECLATDLPALQELGMRLLVHFPDASQLDRLWMLHKQLQRAPDDTRLRQDQRKDVGVAALRTCLALRPSWAEPILLEPGKDLGILDTLVYLFANLSGKAAEQVWHRCKMQLFMVIPCEKVRCLIYCILSFRDRAELHRLEQWVASDQDMIGGVALVVLGMFDPIRAVRQIERLPPFHMLLMARNLQRVFFTARPAETCDEIRRLAQSRPKDAHMYFRLAAGCGDQLDTDTVDAILDWLDREVANNLNAPDNAWHAPNGPLALASGLWGRTVLDRFQASAVSSLEDNLAHLACRRVNNETGWVDHAFDAMRAVLLKIAGPGFTRVVNSQLKASNRLSRLYGCKDALIRPDEETLRLLQEIASSEDLWDPEPNSHPVLQAKAIDALAAAGSNAAVIRGILRWGPQISPDVSELRSGKSPMSDEDIQPALQVLEDPRHEQYANAVLAIGISGRKDLAQRIAGILQSAAPQSPIALTSLLALEDLDYADSALLDRLKVQYQSGLHKYHVIRLLAKIDTEEAMDILEQSLPPLGQYDDFDYRVLDYLRRDPVRRARLRQHPRVDPQHARLLGLSHQSLIVNAEEVAERDHLWGFVSGRDPGIHFVGAKTAAIRALAEDQPEAAFELGEMVLTGRSQDYEQMPVLLLELDPERAITALCKYLAAQREKVTCRTIALALRPYASRPDLKIPLRAVLADPSWEARRAGAFAASFLGPDGLADDLWRQARDDSRIEVRSTALKALRRQQQEYEARTLVAVLPRLDGSRAWVVAETILHLADPTVLGMHTDLIGFRAALRKVPFALQRYVSEQLETLSRKIVEDLQSLSERWPDEE